MKNIIITSSAKHLLKGNNTIFPEKNREDSKIFPDGEVYAKLPDVKKYKEAVILHSGYPLPNEGLAELELLLSILKDNKVKTDVFFAYFPYAMQDYCFEEGETNAAQNLIEKLIYYYNVRQISAIDPHFGNREWVKNYPLKSVSCLPLLMEKAKKDFGDDILFLTPDKGGKRRTGISGFNKKRINSFNVEMQGNKENFKGKTVAVVDDMIKTGGTLVKFNDIAKKSGAKKTIALISHGVMPEGVKKIKKNYDKLYLTNTISQKESNIDISELILKNI